jgi:hypothetical protein
MPALPIEEDPLRLTGLAAPAAIFATFWTLAIVLWLKSGQLFWVVNFG